MRSFSGRDILVAIAAIFAVVVFYSLVNQSGTAASAGGDDDDSNTPFAVLAASNAQTAPDFAAKDIDGQNVTLTAARGRGLVLLDFWATWCGPCKMELPQLAQVYQQYKDKGVQFYGVNSDASADEVKAFEAQNGNIGFPCLIDSTQDMARKYGVNGIPHIVIIDESGRIRAQDEGFDPDTATDLPKTLDKLLKENS